MKKDQILKLALLPVAAALLGTLILIFLGNMLEVQVPVSSPIIEPVNDSIPLEIIPVPSKTILLEFLTNSLPTDLI